GDAADGAAAEGELLRARLREAAHVRARRRVLLVFFPREATPALGILAARDADLVAVVDDGRPEVGELERLAEADAARVAGDREHALGVVAAEEVELDAERRLGVGRALGGEHRLELRGVDVALAEKFDRRRAEGVVHDRIKTVT